MIQNFLRTSVNYLDNELTIQVKEAPIINEVLSQYQRNKIIDAINDIVNLKSRSSFSDFYISSDRKLIKNIKEYWILFFEVEAVVDNIGNM